MIMPLPLPRIAVLSVLAGTLLLFEAAPSQARIITCESFDDQPRYCRADVRGGVRLVQQLSKTRCREEDNWGYDRWGVWVSKGCRARFEINSYAAEPYWGGPPPDNRYDRRDHYRGNAPHGTIKCESWGDRQTFCRIPLGNAQVEIERQLSKSPCQLGRNWGWNRGGIWVTGGCRAIFVIY